MKYGGRVVLISKGFGVRRHALAACIALLLAGCSKPAPTVVSVKCNYSRNGFPISAHGGWEARSWQHYETYYWSDGTRTYRGLWEEC